MSKNEDNRAPVVLQVNEGYQATGQENRGHQPTKTLDKGYQASGQVKTPTTTPNVGTRAVVPTTSAKSSGNEK
jgi:hypothetical protein